ncbi:MAG: YbaK/EbsC family protein [Rubellimicrobium sp.]|nr:YbaK/EbsC family protein [Rubellimicrobium sp.]
MSRSLARVTRALAEARIASVPLEMAEGTRTAEDAAAAVGCGIDQIVKSMIFQGAASGRVFLFLTAGSKRVDAARAAALAGEALVRADADTVRAQTGFAIGGVSPVGLVQQVPVWMDRRLLDFDTVWAAAGTPRHVFAAAPQDIARASGAVAAGFTA